MVATAMVQVRMDEKTKQQAAKVLAALGLSVSDAVRIFLARVATHKELSFGPKVPIHETRAAMAEVRTISRVRLGKAAALVEEPVIYGNR